MNLFSPDQSLCECSPEMSESGNFPRSQILVIIARPAGALHQSTAFKPDIALRMSTLDLAAHGVVRTSLCDFTVFRGAVSRTRSITGPGTFILRPSNLHSRFCLIAASFQQCSEI